MLEQTVLQLAQLELAVIKDIREEEDRKEVEVRKEAEDHRVEPVLLVLVA